MSKVSKLDLYVGSIGQAYCNTPSEVVRLNKFVSLYEMTKSAAEDHLECSPKNLDKWRKAYRGILNALTTEGEESKRKSRQLRKVAYEIVESIVDNSVPMPRMKPRYKTDIPVVGITEDFLKFEVDRALTKICNDRSERSVYIDGTGWYKVWWDSLDHTHDRSGDIKIDFCAVDQIYPQPGVKDYHQLEYLFERQSVSISKIYELYGRYITPINETTNVVDIVNCYYLNDDGIVGVFSWAEASQQVIRDEESWQIRKVRKCTHCGKVVPEAARCPDCFESSFKYEVADVEVLDQPLQEVYNPYDAGEVTDPAKKDEYSSRVFMQQGETVPFYVLRQLPFIPRPAISNVDTLYGMSVVNIILDMQDMINKVYTKAVDKTLKSGAVVTKPEKVKMNETDESFKVIGVRSQEEATMFQVKQIMADTSQDMAIAATMYDSAKSSSGITDSFQGKRDTTALSGKAKAYSVMQSEGRIESLRVMKSAAFAGLYELVFKFLLAFSDEERKFVKIMPDGSQVEQVWNKYMFLDKDASNQVYYRDDFEFDTDTAATLSTNRQAMWEETTNKFIQGAFGNPSESRTLEAYWNMMDALQYPLSRTALAAIKENAQHLPEQVEQAIMQNPEIMAALQSMLQEGAETRGGARPNSGPAGNGKTHAANVETTNLRNKANAGTENQILKDIGGIE